MRMTSCVAAVLAAAVLAVPVGAAIKAMNLAELMSITDDAVYGTIVEKSSVRLDLPWDGAIYTKLVVEGESLRTGETGLFEMVFLGSHDRADDFVVSEMPTLKDSRLGGKTVVLFEKAKQDLLGLNVVHSLANLYRVEEGFGQPVVIGKGEGFAFAQNTTLADVRVHVRDTHLQLAKLGKLHIPGLDK